MQTLEGTGFRLRKWKMEDAFSLVKHANNNRISRYLRDGFPYPYTLPDAHNWIDTILHNSSDLVYAIEVNDEACGGIGLHGMKDVYRYNAEIGYWLSERYWGRGITSEAVQLLIKAGFEEHRWVRIFAGVFSNNPASMKVLAKAGFKEEAVFRKSVKKNGEFLDEHVWSILKEEWVKFSEQKL